MSNITVTTNINNPPTTLMLNYTSRLLAVDMPKLKAAFVVLKAELTSKKKIEGIKKKVDGTTKDVAPIGFSLGQTNLFTLGNTIVNEPPIALWGWSRTAEFFRYPEGSDDPTYPIDGVRSMKRDHPAWKGYVNSDEEWIALQDFFSKFESSVNDHSIIYACSVNKPSNPLRTGAKIYSKFFNDLMIRSKSAARIDSKLRELGVSPPQIYAHRQKPYPPRHTVGKMCFEANTY